MQAAKAIAGERAVFLVGLVGVEESESLSKAAMDGPLLRRQLQEAAGLGKIHGRFVLRVAHSLWQELLQTIHQEDPDLVILEWPCDLQVLGVRPDEAFAQVPCDLAIVRGPLPTPLKRILLTLRGGPSAELALKLGLNASRQSGAQLTTLHLESPLLPGQVEAPFRGLDQVLRSLREVQHMHFESARPAEDILRLAREYDLIVLGARAASPQESVAFGPTAEKVISESPQAVMVVKARRALPAEQMDESAGQQAISVLVDKWFAENTYHAEEFSDLHWLLERKREQGVTISLALPALNEEQTVGNVIQTVKEALMDEVPCSTRSCSWIPTPPMPRGRSLPP